MVMRLPEREWEGPEAFEFEFYSGHTKTARYRCMLEKHAFDFYAPLFKMDIDNDDDIPDRIQAVIWKSSSPVRTCGYLSEPLLLATSKVGQFLNRTLLYNQVAFTSSLRPWL